MNPARIEAIRRVINPLIANCPNFERPSCVAHLEGVAAMSSLIAGKRGLDAELATTAALLHDAYAYRVGSYFCHAHNAAEMARVLLKRMGLHSDAERFIICSAIFSHDDLHKTDGPYEEVLKNADILFPLMQCAGLQVSAPRLLRAQRLAMEFGFPLDAAAPEGIGDCAGAEKLADLSERIASTAEALARQSVIGDRQSETFADWMHYWPEDNALEELTFGWCAAFVYHVIRSVGMELPIRHPLYELRFACVLTWYQWAVGEKFYFENDGKFAPQRGDLVIYSNILPPHKKAANSIWCDHIGIVVDINGDQLIVAEGNADGDNVSALVPRRVHSHIAGYIRISPDYKYAASQYTYADCVWGRL